MANQYDKASDIRKWTNVVDASQGEVDNIIAAYNRVKTNLLNFRTYMVANANSTFTAEDLTKLDAQISSMASQISSAIS